MANTHSSGSDGLGTATPAFGDDRMPARSDSQKSSRDRDRDDEAGAPRQKRRRTAVACSSCRLRKSRCNGKSPKCSMCDTLGLECVYDASDSSMSSIATKEHMIEFQARLTHLEAAIRRHEQALETNDLLPKSSDNPALQSSGFSRATDVRASQSFSNNADGLRSADIQESYPEIPSTDGMAITYVSEEDSGYFGQTSNIALMRHISRAIVFNGNLEGLTSPQMSDDVGLVDNGIVSVSRPPSPNLGLFPGKTNQAHRGVMLNALPSESVMRGLIEKYFSNTGRLFPYIHAPSFLETYEQMRSDGSTKVRRTWLGLLNIVLAIASNANSQQSESQPANERIVQSDEYYQRALGLYQTQILRGSSLETVQYLLLMSQYLQGAQKSVQTWAIHGLAVKAAMSIGLHSTDASRKLPSIEREFRNRTWFGCVILDRTLSMTFGRPMTIPEEHFKLPLPQPENIGLRGAGEGSLDAEEVKSVAFFTATISLYQIMGRVITTLYGGNLGCGTVMPRKDMATAIFQFEQEIDEWNHSLPDYLRVVSPWSDSINPSDTTQWTKYQVILSLRCLNIQVLLYRPALIRSIDRSGEVAVQSTTRGSMNRIEKNHMDSCLKSAKGIIDMIHLVVTSPLLGKDLLGAWWFSLYYVFNSVLVAFGSQLTYSKNKINSASDQVGACRLLLARAVQALRLLDKGNITVERCVLFVEEMSHKLDIFDEEVSGAGAERSLSRVSGSTATENAANTSHAVRCLSPGKDNGLGTVAHNQVAGAVEFLFEHGYNDELELSQFFLGGGMESWADFQG